MIKFYGKWGEGKRVVVQAEHPPLLRLAKKKKMGKKKKVVKVEAACSPASPATAQPEALGATAVRSSRADKDTERQGSAQEAEPEACSQPLVLVGQPRLLIPEMKDASVARGEQVLSSNMIHTLGRQLDVPDQSFRSEAPGEAPSEGPLSGGLGEGISAPMHFYRFTVESPNSAAPGGGHHDPPRDGQPPHVPGGPEAPGEEEGGEERKAAGPVVEEEEEMAAVAAANMETLSKWKGDQASPSPSSAEDSGVEEGQGSPSEASHPSEFR